jgi:ABC-type multidrug transport system permease subunit
MTVFITLLKTDLKMFLKDWKAVLLLLILPLFFIYLFVDTLSSSLTKNSFVEPFKIALVDKEDSTQTRVLIKQLDEIKIFKEVIRVPEDEAKMLISEDRIGAAIVIPKGFSRSLRYGENKPVTVIGNKNRPLQSYITKNLALSAANLVASGQCAINTIYYYNRLAGLRGKELEKDFNESTMSYFVDALGRNQVFSEAKGASGYTVTAAEHFTAALIVVFLMFAGMPGMKMIVTERSMGITRRLAASPVKMRQIVLSKFIVSFILSLLQFLIIIVFTSVVFNNYWGAPLQDILVLFGGVIFAVSAWSVFVSSISKTPAAADIIGNISILLMAVVGGNIYPLSSMPEFARQIGNVTINKWAMEGFEVLFSGSRGISILNYVFPLLLIGAVLLTASFTALKIRE